MIQKLSVIQFGNLGINYNETINHENYHFKKNLGIYGESSVVLLTLDSGLNILLDTGYRNEWDLSPQNKNMNKNELLFRLKANNCDLDDIDEIFITHWHHDHFGNLPLFKNAIICYAGISSEKCDRIFKKINISNPYKQLASTKEWHEELEILQTPGHNRSHHSVIIQYMDHTIIFAGDAIVSKDYFDQDEVYSYNGDFYSKEVALISQNRIAEIADFIIPGHGQPFQNWKKKF